MKLKLHLDARTCIGLVYDFRRARRDRDIKLACTTQQLKREVELDRVEIRGELVCALVVAGQLSIHYYDAAVGRR